MAAEAKYDMTVHPLQALVRSQSDGAAAHLVTFPGCDCADYINRRGALVELPDGVIAVTLCKHIAEGLRRIGGWNSTGPASEVIDNLDHNAVRELLMGPRVKMTATGVRSLTSALGMGRTQEYEFVGQKGKGYATYDARLSRFTVTLLH